MKRRRRNNLCGKAHASRLPFCLEAAINENVTLDGIDLRGVNLSGANLDGARMRGANFGNANLTGANLSECDLQGANFSGAALYNACLCESDLSGCNFSYAHFGATDIRDSVLQGCRFAGLSAFTLDWTSAQDIQNMTYETPDGQAHSLSRPPVTIKGLSYPVSFLDEVIMIGHDAWPYDADPAALPVQKRALFLALRDNPFGRFCRSFVAGTQKTLY